VDFDLCFSASQYPNFENWHYGVRNKYKKQ
jgi:hypothetical protein